MLEALYTKWTTRVHTAPVKLNAASDALGAKSKISLVTEPSTPAWHDNHHTQGDFCKGPKNSTMLQLRNWRMKPLLSTTKSTCPVPIESSRRGSASSQHCACSCTPHYISFSLTILSKCTRLSNNPEGRLQFPADCCTLSFQFRGPSWPQTVLLLLGSYTGQKPNRFKLITFLLWIGTWMINNGQHHQPLVSHPSVRATSTRC